MRIWLRAAARGPGTGMRRAHPTVRTSSWYKRAAMCTSGRYSRYSHKRTLLAARTERDSYSNTSSGWPNLNSCIHAHRPYLAAMACARVIAHTLPRPAAWPDDAYCQPECCNLQVFGAREGPGDSEGGGSDGARCALQSIAIWSHSATYMLTGVGR
jgi:hypothetical protein